MSNSTVAEISESLQSVSDLIHLVLDPVLLLVGLLGNAASLYTLKTVSGFNDFARKMLMVVAILDILYLLLVLPGTWVNALTTGAFNLIMVAKCKIMPYLIQAVAISSVWCVVAIMGERLACAYIPHTYSRYFSGRTVYAWIASILLLAFAVELGAIIVMEAATRGHGGICRTVGLHATVMQTVVFFIYSVLPITICITSAALIIKKIRSQTIGRRLSHPLRRHALKITKSLLAISVSMVVTTGTFSLLFALSRVDAILTFLGTGSRSLLLGIADVFSTLNPTCNFFLYVTASSILRKHFIEKIKHVFARNSRVHPQITRQ